MARCGTLQNYRHSEKGGGLFTQADSNLPKSNDYTNGGTFVMAKFKIPLRYQTAYTPEAEKFTEANFRRREIMASFAPEEVGIVLLDIHNWGWGPEPLDAELGYEFELAAEHGTSFGRRMKQIIAENIAPALEAARSAGVSVFHFNIPHILRHYSQWKGEYTPLAKTSPDDKPKNFRTAFREKHGAYTHDLKREALRGRLAPKIDLPEPVKPIGNERCVSDDQLDQFLEERVVNVLFFTGFWADVCVHDYFGHANKYGYLCVVLRDATTGAEFAHTLDGMWVTELAITRMEGAGFSTTTDAFIQACQNISSGP